MDIVPSARALTIKIENISINQQLHFVIYSTDTLNISDHASLFGNTLNIYITNRNCKSSSTSHFFYFWCRIFEVFSYISVVLESDRMRTLAPEAGISGKDK